MMNCLTSWPEPVVRVQHLSDSGIRIIPDRYVKKPSDRPRINDADAVLQEQISNIPVVDMQDLCSDDVSVREGALKSIDAACREWGFFQVVNHGVSGELMARTCEVWREFFKLPLEEKLKYANSPSTYEGYGSRLGVEKGISLDWSDYFFLHYLPVQLMDKDRWPSRPGACRDLVAEYSAKVVELGGKLLKIFSGNLGLEEDYLTKAFGGEQGLGACLRVSYYPKCPQPDLTLGLSPHSDPGGMTLLFSDEPGLQVRRCGAGGDGWVTVRPLPGAFVVNLGDQLQVLSNAIYKSVEHRVVVNSDKERLSLAMFYNPKGDAVVKPAEQLVPAAEAPRYPAMTFDEYRLFIRTRGPSGKAQVESLMSKSFPN